MTFPFETSASDLLPSLKAEVARLVSSSPSRERPVFLHTLGVPGAGKSSFVRVLRQKLESYAPVYVGFDRLMESMPEYKAEPDIEKAFKKYELPARSAGYLLLKELIAKKANILLDHGGSFSQNIEMLRYAQTSKNYSIIVARVVVSPETAKSRIWARQAIEGRHTPLAYVDERNGILTSLLPHYKEVADAYFEIANDVDSDNPESPFENPSAQIAENWENMR